MNSNTKCDVGIVLSGGGSRAIAHIGVLRALEEHGISPGIVAGASAGALVGAFYAAGYTPDQMLEFFNTRSPFRFSNFALTKPGIIDTAKVIRDFEEYFPANRFEALKKKLRIVATDIVSGEGVVFDAGPLIPPVLASSSVPLVFTPTRIDGRLFSDAGIVNNFPVELLEGRCRITLGVYATPLRATSESDLTHSLAVLKRSWDVGMFNASKPKFEKCDLLICPEELGRFGIFDTKNLDEIEQIGYVAACEQMDTILRL
jgi:NTE family protein